MSVWLLAASGPSQRKEDLDLARGKARVLVINRTWELAPWAEVLYSGDRKFWQENDTSGFEGRKIAGDVPVDGAEFLNVLSWLPVCRRFNNSGAQALMLVPTLGNRENRLLPKRVILTGYDMQGRHWHPDHKTNPSEANMTLWREGFPLLGAWLGALGIEILNASRETALTCFPRVDLEEVMK